MINYTELRLQDIHPHIIRIGKKIYTSTDDFFEFCRKLKNYKYIFSEEEFENYEPDDDEDEQYIETEPDIGAYIRYIDTRDIPIKLYKGGHIVTYSDKDITLKKFNSYWKIQRNLCYVFQKKSNDELFIESVQKAMKTKIQGTE